MTYGREYSDGETIDMAMRRADAAEREAQDATALAPEIAEEIARRMRSGEDPQIEAQEAVRLAAESRGMMIAEIIEDA